MPAKLGLDAKLYRNSGTYASPTWELIGNVRDVTLSLETGEADVTTRGNNGWRASVGTLKGATIEFQMVWDTSDTDFTAIQTAFFTSTNIEFAVMDGDITTTGSQGLRADCRIITFSRAEALEEAITVSVTAKPTYTTNPPTWHTVT